MKITGLSLSQTPSDAPKPSAEILERHRRQYVDMVRHEVPLDYLDDLILAEPPENLPYVPPDLPAYRFPPMLRREYDVVFAHPLRVREALGFLDHSRPPPFHSDFDGLNIVNIRQKGGFVRQIGIICKAGGCLGAAAHAPDLSH